MPIATLWKSLARKRGDTDEMFAFCQRMATGEAKTLYKQRPSVAEFPNAECRNRGLCQFRVRGLAKARAVARIEPRETPLP